MALGKISSLFASQNKGKKKNKLPTSSNIHPFPAELQEKNFIELESQKATKAEDYSVGRHNSININTTWEIEKDNPHPHKLLDNGREEFLTNREKWCLREQIAEKDKKILELENERQEFLKSKKKWSLREQIVEKDKKILELESTIAELQKKHMEEIKSLEEEKRSVIKELGRTISHYKEKMREKKWFRRQQ